MDSRSSSRLTSSSCSMIGGTEFHFLLVLTIAFLFIAAATVIAAPSGAGDPQLISTPQEKQQFEYDSIPIDSSETEAFHLDQETTEKRGSGNPGVMRFGKKSFLDADDFSIYKKSNPGVMRFGKRGNPGVMRFGKRSNPGVMRFGKRSNPGVMRFGKRSNPGAMRFGKRGNPGVMRFG